MRGVGANFATVRERREHGTFIATIFKEFYFL
jgi:hypothetical protein